MIETQQQDQAKGLQDALMQAAFNAEQNSEGAAEKAKTERKAGAVSPRNGAQLPAGTGRPKGVKNKLTNLREAVLEAFDQVGGVQYLARLAEGTQSDRAAFVGLVSKVLPTQINANVEGGIQVQLSWLSARSIGTTQAQVAEEVTQVVDLERDSAGKYRIKDQDTAAQAPADAAGRGQEGAKDA